MQSSRSNHSDHSLRSVVTYAEAEVQRLLDTAGTAPLDAVAWLSAHLAALDHAVYPVVKRTLPDGKDVVAQHREIAARLTRTLRVLERHHSGDVLASGLNSNRLLGNLRDLLVEHQAAESQLVERMVQALPAPAQSALIKSYESALEHAPTRPHPHLSRGSLMFRLDGIRDRALDAMDGRHVPVPRLVRDRITPGRWGAYFLGQPSDHHPAPSSAPPDQPPASPFGDGQHRGAV
jgi:hypothetical protein